MKDNTNTGHAPSGVGIRIREVRKRLGLSQAEFGEKTGFPQSIVSMWEVGIRNPGYSSIRKICDTFGLTVYEFYGSPETDDDRELSEYISGLRKTEVTKSGNSRLIGWLEELRERRGISFQGKSDE